MKRIARMLICVLLVLCVALPTVGFATAAMTQDEWDLSCTKKTSEEATLYEFTGDKPGASLGTLPKGTYVKVDGAKSDHWMGLIYLKNGEETKGWAQVALEDCVSKIKKSDGRLYDVHEKDPNYNAKIAEGTLVFDVKLYSDYAAYLSYSIGLGPEPLRKDGKVTDPNATAGTVSGQATGKTTDATSAKASSNTDASDEEEPVDDEEEPVDDEYTVDDAELADDAENADDTATVDDTANTTDTAALTGDEEVVELGLYQSKVKVGKKNQVVLTSALTLSADVDEDHQLAVVYTPRSGSATLRKKAATNGGTIKKLDAGTVVRVLEVGDTYTKVLVGKKEGYIGNKSLQFYAPVTSTEGTAQLSKNGKADGRSVINIRCAADKDSAKVDAWKTGTDVVVFSHADGWYEIEANGKHGYVMEQFLTMDE